MSFSIVMARLAGRKLFSLETYHVADSHSQPLGLGEGQTQYQHEAYKGVIGRAGSQ